jgi:glycosyltransferase involved in cell wall biosynthesis
MPLVSIICTTFNQEKYIDQALEGFVMQKTTFPFEIIVHDDASTDNTPLRIKAFESAYPHLFVTIFQTENQYSKGDYTIDRITYGTAKGKYISLCEGDDYWTDPFKLQKQFDFLEANDDYGLVYSKVQVFSQKDNKFLKNTYGKPFSSIEDLFISNYVPTPTVMFRASLYSDYIKTINPYEQKWLMGDYPLWMYITSVSKVKYIDNTCSVYRLLDNSAAHSTNPEKELMFVESYQDIKLYFMKKLGFNHLEKEIRGHCYSSKAHIYLFKNEHNISELVKDIDASAIKSVKIWIIRIIISNFILRKILKLYWSL